MTYPLFPWNGENNVNRMRYINVMEKISWETFFPAIIKRYLSQDNNYGHTKLITKLLWIFNSATFIKKLTWSSLKFNEISL
jgi:hypothetical protein